MRRVYKCVAHYSKGIDLAIEASITYDKSEKIKDIEAELKEAVAEEFSTNLRKFTANDITLKLKK